MTNPIVSAKIHPGIGIARIGNSDDYYLAPQVMQPVSKEPGFYHDASGKLKREAVEFRIYGYDSQGNVVGELTADNAAIEWDVHLCARKAAWYKFTAALDIPQSDKLAMPRRNTKYDPTKRDDLVIDPGSVQISGKNSGQNPLIACEGRFTYETKTQQVLIGELKTDENGRLHVLSGKGHSASPTGLPVYNKDEKDSFANATGWFDDIADGPVDATILIDGKNIPCEGAWAVSAPPNYAPDIVSWRTLNDLLEELYEDAGWITPSKDVSFTRDIYPLLARMSGLQWVNKGFSSLFGSDGPLDFTQQNLIDKLCKIHGNDDTYKHLRRTFYNAFRPHDDPNTWPDSWPWIYGDAFGTFADTDPDNFLQLWPTAQKRLQSWVAGDFIADWGKVNVPSNIDEIPTEKQPDMLDKAPLHFCLADAFHPGCELTWPMRHISIYDKPYRIKRRAAGVPEADYGDELTQKIALGPDGPLHKQGPGELSRWMAVPWQVDTAGCRSGYDKKYDPYLPTFWPAGVPNTVLTEENYEIVMDDTASIEDRLAAFHDRRTWYYPLMEQGGDQMTLMVTMFAALGVIERRDGPVDGKIPQLPSSVYVEKLPPHLVKLKSQLMAVMEEHPLDVPDTPEQKLAREAGWESVEQRNYFQQARFPERFTDDG